MDIVRSGWAQCGGLSSNEMILPGGAILDILRAIVLMILLLGVGALTSHRNDVQRVPIWTAFGLVLGGLGYRGGHL